MEETVRNWTLLAIEEAFAEYGCLKFEAPIKRAAKAFAENYSRGWTRPRRSRNL